MPPFQDDGSGVRVKVENALHASHLRSAMEMKTEFVPEDLAQKSIGKVLMEKVGEIREMFPISGWLQTANVWCQMHRV